MRLQKVIGSYLGLKVYTKRIPESYLPSLATSGETKTSNSEWIMEKSRNFHIVYAGRTNLSKQTN